MKNMLMLQMTTILKSSTWIWIICMLLIYLIKAITKNLILFFTSRYGAAQKQCMPVGSFEWCDPDIVYREWSNWTSDQEFGYMIECDVMKSFLFLSCDIKSWILHFLNSLSVIVSWKVPWRSSTLPKSALSRNGHDKLRTSFSCFQSSIGIQTVQV